MKTFILVLLLCFLVTLNWDGASILKCAANYLTLDECETVFKAILNKSYSSLFFKKKTIFAAIDNCI